MSRFAIYNIKQTTCLTIGVPIEDGRGDDPYLEFEFPDAWEYVKSADGLLVRCATNDTEVKCKLKLKGSSLELGKLSALHSADLIAGGGAGVGVFGYKDNNGGTKIAAKHCWIHKFPTFGVGKLVPDVTIDLRMQIDPGKMLLAGHWLED